MRLAKLLLAALCLANFIMLAMAITFLPSIVPMGMQTDEVFPAQPNNLDPKGKQAFQAIVSVATTAEQGGRFLGKAVLFVLAANLAISSIALWLMRRQTTPSTPSDATSTCFL